MILDTHELAWAAGFFDGEGCVVRYRATQRPAKNPRKQHREFKRAMICMGQIHPEVLERFRAAVGRGNVRGPYPAKRKNESAIWQFSTASFESVQAIMCMLWPWLGTVKRQQFLKAMREVREHQQWVEATRHQCVRGHDLREHGRLRKDGKARACQACWDILYHERYSPAARRLLST